ncbi:MAG: sugar ABC transporter permease [Clostridia bacterium]|nr:sugar ABC transporter permease [Clostridia bacterium]
MGRQLKRDSLISNTCKHKGLLMMAIPGFAMMLLFSYMPMVGLLAAFKEYDYTLGLLGSEWCGFENFRLLLESKDITIRIVRNTVLYWCLLTTVGTIMNVGIAILIYECTANKFGKYSHMIMIFPTFVSWISVSYIAKAFLNDGNGMINNILSTFGMTEISWYLTPKFWPIILLVVHVWKNCGYGSVIYLSALAGIDPSLFEAAEIDGASKPQKIRFITLPMLKSMVSINILLALGGIMHSNTGLFYQVTRNTGILYSTTQTIDAYVMNALSSGSDLGSTAAVTLFQSVIGCIMVVSVNWLVRRKDEDNALF